MRANALIVFPDSEDQPDRRSRDSRNRCKRRDKPSDVSSDRPPFAPVRRFVHDKIVGPANISRHSIGRVSMRVAFSTLSNRTG